MENLGRIRAENQLIFLNTGKLVGVQSAMINPEFGAKSLNYIGIGNKQVNQILNSEQFATLSLESFLINSDPFIQYTGNDCFNIFILKTQDNIIDNYCLTSGYLTSYRTKFTVGQPVQVGIEAKFISNAGNITVNNLDSNSSGQLASIPQNIYDVSEPEYDIANGQSVNLTLDEYNTSRVIDSSINLEINRVPIYNIGNKQPKRIEIIYPITVSCEFTIQVGEYNYQNLRSFPSGQKVQNIQFDVYSYNTNRLITSYKFNNMTAVAEQRNSSVDDNVLITKKYVGYIYS